MTDSKNTDELDTSPSNVRQNEKLDPITEKIEHYNPDIHKALLSTDDPECNKSKNLTETISQNGSGKNKPEYLTAQHFLSNPPNSLNRSSSHKEINCNSDTAVQVT